MNYNPLRMCMGKDGNLSLTRTAACTAHLSFAITVAYLTYIKQDFLLDMWSLYITVAVLHASYDKTAAMVLSIKNRKLDQEEAKVAE